MGEVRSVCSEFSKKTKLQRVLGEYFDRYPNPRIEEKMTKLEKKNGKCICRGEG